MSSVTRDLIEYSGINDGLPLSPNNFKQINIEDEFTMPIQKPDIEQIVKVDSSAIIKNTRIIKTPKGISLEGLRLTGHKLLIEGLITYKVQYVANIAEQSTHTSNFTTPFIAFIVLSEDFSTTSQLTASAFIEDVYVNTIDLRCIYVNTTLLLTAEEC